MTEEIKDIRIVPEAQCCGCGGCANTCPVDAISLMEGTDGFLFPVVNTEKCIQCGKCVKNCPALEITKPNRKLPDCRAAYAQDEIRKVSSSGGIFSMLAEYVFERNGVVYGAALNEQFEVVHRRITSMEELSTLRRSKYVQSQVGMCYRQVKQDLKEGKTVLFSGTPCQNAGLRKYLGKENENLVLVDIVCHGVPSQSVFNEYLKERFPGDQLKEFLFRTKGARQSCTVCQATLKDGRKVIIDIKDDPYEKGYHRGLFLRESCSSCRYSEPPRQGDFTIGDFWNIEKYYPDYYDALGVSLVFMNNEKADVIWGQIENKMKFSKPVPAKYALWNNRFKARGKIHPDRERFFELRGKAPFSVVVDSVLEGVGIEDVMKARRKMKLKNTAKKIIPVPVKRLIKKVLIKGKNW